MRRAKVKQQNKKKLYERWKKERGEARTKGEKLTGILKDWGGYYSKNKSTTK